MPSDQPSASTVDADAAPASLSSPRWKKPAPGPHPRTGDCNRGPNPRPLGPPSSGSELERRFRDSAEAAKLALAAAAAARGSGASVAADGGRQRLGLAVAGVTVDAGQGAIQSLWTDADEATFLAAAAAFRERTGRAPRRPDAAALLDSIRDSSISQHIDEATAYDKLTRLESEFLHGAPGGSGGTHDRRVHDLSAKVWGVADVVSPPEDDPDGQDAEESSSDERRLITERAPKPAPAPRVDAPMPSSERSSTSSMDADAASASPSPPISKKRSPSPHGSPSRRSEPNCRLRMDRTSAEAESTAGTVALATAAAAAAALGSNADGGREDVQSLEPAGVAVNLGHVAAQRLEPADYPKTWSDADEVTLLGAAAAFRERTGRIPLKRDAGVLLRSIRGSISPHINESRLSCKLVHFKAMFRHQAPGESATAHDHLVHDLSSKVWGFVNSVAREARDASTMMPVVTEVLDEYWKMNERAFTGLPLEKGLSLVRKKEGRLIETRWRKQLDEEMQTQMRRHDLAKEICVLLNDTIKGLRS